MDAGAYKSQKRAKKRDATDVSHSNSSWDERMMVRVVSDNQGHFEQMFYSGFLIEITGGEGGVVHTALSPDCTGKDRSDVLTIRLEAHSSDSLRAFFDAVHPRTSLGKNFTAEIAEKVAPWAAFFGLDWLLQLCDRTIAIEVVAVESRGKMSNGAILSQFDGLFSESSGRNQLLSFRNAIRVWELAARLSMVHSEWAASHVVCNYFNDMKQAPASSDVFDILNLMEGVVACKTFPRTDALTVAQQSELQRAISDFDEWDAVLCYNHGVNGLHNVSDYPIPVQIAMWRMLAMDGRDVGFLTGVDRLKFHLNTFLPNNLDMLGENIEATRSDSLSQGATCIRGADLCTLLHAGMEIVAIQHSLSFIGQYMSAVVSSVLPTALQGRSLRCACERLKDRAEHLRSGQGYLDLNSYTVTGVPSGAPYDPAGVSSDADASDESSDDSDGDDGMPPADHQVTAREEASKRKFNDTVIKIVDEMDEIMAALVTADRDLTNSLEEESRRRDLARHSVTNFAHAMNQVDIIKYDDKRIRDDWRDLRKAISNLVPGLPPYVPADISDIDSELSSSLFNLISGV